MMVGAGGLFLLATSFPPRPYDAAPEATHVVRAKVVSTRFISRRERGIPDDDRPPHQFVVEVLVDVTQVLRPRDEKVPTRMLIRSREAACLPQKDWLVGEELYFFTVQRLGRGGRKSHFQQTYGGAFFYPLRQKDDVERALRQEPGPSIRLRTGN